MTYPLSVLDVVPVGPGMSAGEALRNSIALAQHVERLGYTRYWLAEHHNMPGIASTTPEIMIGQIARETTHLRVGSGGVMLPNHAPLKVAESFRMLEALFPDRIDLGIGRAPGTDGMTALALRGSRAALTADDFPQQLSDLLAFGGEGFGQTHPFRRITAVPADVALPPVWLLGSSGFSAQLAAQQGLGFAFAHHINPYGAEEAMAAYRAAFVPSAHLAAPHAIIAASVFCAPTHAEAEALALPLIIAFLRMHSGTLDRMLTTEEAARYTFSPAERAMLPTMRERHIIGDPAEVKAQLDALVEATGAQELMITTNTVRHADRVRSYELLAAALALGSHVTA
jgi:luciferase family oxidoreductase group 1